jgi:C1A family cysteine protease
MQNPLKEGVKPVLITGHEKGHIFQSHQPQSTQLKEANMTETRIDEVPELDEFLVSLKSLGYRNTDQLVGAHEITGDLLADYLKTDAAKLRMLINKIPQRPKPKGIAAAPMRRFALGVQLDRIPRPRRAFRMSAVSAEPLPPKMNMIPQMPPVRDQGDRGTCVAHACLAVMEHYLSTRICLNNSSTGNANGRMESPIAMVLG